MAILIVEHPDVHARRRRGLVLGKRALIGRWGMNDVCLDDPRVSRLHAWIGCEQGRHYIADPGSRTGTLVNGQRVVGRRVLSDGDQIRIAGAMLRFADANALPAGVSPLSAPERAPKNGEANGQALWCRCGAPLWIPRDWVGRKVGHCRACGRRVFVPAVEVESAPEAQCGICHSGIGSEERSIRCLECATAFHELCWGENGGCSSYGCGQAPAPPSADVAPPAEALEFEPQPRQPLPWLHLALLLSLLLAASAATGIYLWWIQQ